MTLPRLAYLTGEYPRASDTFIQREVAALRALGHDVLTCSIRTTGPEHLVGPEQRAEHAGTFKVLDACRSPLRLIRAHGRWMRQPGRYLRALSLAWRTAPEGVRGRACNLIYFAEAAVLARHLDEIGATHLHNHIAKQSGTVAMLAAEIAGLPHSFTLHGPDIFFAPEHWRLDEKVARATFVACISNFARSQAMLFSDRAHWDKLHIVHCGVEPGRYASPVEGPGTRLLYVGRLDAVKGVRVLFDALQIARAERPGLTLTLIGDGPDRAALERAAPEGTSFLGFRNQDDVAAALAEHDALVLPSFAEGVPVVLMEAMAAARPVVATSVGGVSELVRHGETGLLVPPGDEVALARALVKISGDAALRQRLGLAGRERVRSEFDAREEAARLAILFHAYGAGAPRPARRPGDRP